jgi:anti-sigma B factor antagonist
MSASTPLEPEFAITSVQRDGERVIAVTGELDLGSAERVQQELGRAQADDEGPIVLDLSGLTFIDSTGLRVIIEANERLAAGESGWAIVPGPEPVHRVFELTGTAERLPFRAATQS